MHGDQIHPNTSKSEQFAYARVNVTMSFAHGPRIFDHNIECISCTISSIQVRSTLYRMRKWGGQIVRTLLAPHDTL